MARLTKSDIENKLLAGTSLLWLDASKKKSQLSLSDSKARRLFAFLLSSTVRTPTGLTQQFIDDLAAAYARTDDPAVAASATQTTASNSSPWRLQFIETEGFGGLNIWNGAPFHYDFDQESLLIDGPNGSGKSSLVGAILWALSGDRPRDQSEGQAHEPKPVFGSDPKLEVGSWPPIACYPSSIADIKSSPRVHVTLQFKNSAGVATIARTLENGKVTATISPGFEFPSIFLETGLLMPARLATLRLSGRESRLTDAVQKLTGLDDLVAIGTLAEGLCHKSREYLSYKKKDLATSTGEFGQAIEGARASLLPLKIPVPDFTPADTDDDKGEMAKFGKTLTEKAAELTQVISTDLSSDLALETPAVQNQVVSAISVAEEDIRLGIENLSAWRFVEPISLAFDDAVIQRVSEALASARQSAVEAVQLLEKSHKDSKFQLKALAAQWYVHHKSGAIDTCPLCDHSLHERPLLAKDLEELRSAGDAAARAFEDNLNAILTDLEISLPASLKKLTTDVLKWEPHGQFVADIRATFVAKDRSAKILRKFGSIIEAALSSSPKQELPVAPETEKTEILHSLTERIAVIERLLDLAGWYRANKTSWSEWWNAVANGQDADTITSATESAAPKTEAFESLSAHLSRLSAALNSAEPYRKAAASMRAAWKVGKIASAIKKELDLREAIAESVSPLKGLVSLAESVAREAIDGLSGRIAKLLKRIHLTEQFQFQEAHLNRKEGVVVHGAFGSDLRIDATLVANTSWLRAVLWAFTFALREEAVEQRGNDVFPILVFDDPQATFDPEHRHRWSQYVAALQGEPSKAQILLMTYDEMFLELIKINGVVGRQALIASAGPELGHVGIFEGDLLDREWSAVKTLNTPKAGRDYISAVRVYLEGLLRLMLRAEDPQISSSVIGSLREKLRQLHDGGVTPWNRSEFKRLGGLLTGSQAQIKHLENSHHATGVNLGMAEAIDVEEYWRKSLRPALERGFKISREYVLLHGGLKALHAPAPLILLPEGYQSTVRSIPLQLLGRAAALSDGRIADGRFDLNEFPQAGSTRITLARHSTYRLVAPTLEPVARPGDLLLVKEAGIPSVKSLVVALSDDRILARRFEIAENHSDIAVLTAQAINPRRIAPPVIAHKATFILHKVIGVLYEDSAWAPPLSSSMEVSECGGGAILTSLTANALGLVEIVGQSAEPHALNGQYIIVKKEIIAEEALKVLDGKPVIASDTDDNRYFKRLRIGIDQVVLESMDSGGDYGPVILSMPGKGKNCLDRVWPVAGVLFELPN